MAAWLGLDLMALMARETLLAFCNSTTSILFWPPWLTPPSGRGSTVESLSPSSLGGIELRGCRVCLEIAAEGGAESRYRKPEASFFGISLVWLM